MEVKEDDTFIIKGLPPISAIPDIPLGRFIYESLNKKPLEYEIMVDVLTGKSLTYKDILERTVALAAGLLREGYKKDTIFSICSENSLEFFIPVIAVLYIGGVIVPINHTYTEQEMFHALNIGEPRVMFCSKNTHEKISRLKHKMKNLEKVIVLDSQSPFHEGSESMVSFMRKSLRGNRDMYRFRPIDVDINTQTAFMLFSSGTTGLPKGVMLTHRNILARFTQGLDPRLYVKDANDVTLGIMPFFHAFGLFVTLSSIVNQVKVTMLTRFEEKSFLDTIEKYRISSLPLVPPLAVFLAKSPLVEKYDLSSVKEISCGAAPLRKEVEETLKNRLKLNTIRQAYGLTEGTLAITIMPTNAERFGSSGKVVPHMLCKIRDPETGKSLGPNQVGEVCLKGVYVMKGYYKDEEATRNAFTSDGWLLTGDLAYYDEDEFFFIVDRLKELIKYKGFQVAPAELEALLLTNPEVLDAGVVGLPDEESGELPLAFVVKKPDSMLTEKDVQLFVAQQVSPAKRLRGGVIFVPEIPKNASGKILRRKLREMIKKQTSKL